jgi:hypothetical protein
MSVPRASAVPVITTLLSLSSRRSSSPGTALSTYNCCTLPCAESGPTRTVGVAVGVAVGVGMVAVAVAVGIPSVGVSVIVAVAVGSPIVGVSVRVAVTVAFCVLVGVEVGPSVGLSVAVPVAVAVGPSVGLSVAVLVTVVVGLLVAVAVGPLGSVGVNVGGCCVAVGVGEDEPESSSLPQAANSVSDKASSVVRTRWQIWLERM